MSSKVLIICGPTAVGKTSLAISLAKEFKGELISADSRQVYQGMDIVTGKDLPKDSKFQKSKLSWLNKDLGFYNFGQIPVWGLDLVKPDDDFSAAHWVKLTHLLINDIWKRNKLPIIVGGTGFWIKTLLAKTDSLGVAPDYKLRKFLNKKNIKELVDLLKKLDLNKFNQFNPSDQANPRRLIRAIEVIKAGKKRKLSSEFLTINKKNVLKIGLKAEINYLENKIETRVKERMKQGALQEVRVLLKNGYDFDLASMSACGYRIFQAYFKNNYSQDELVKKWYQSERSYLKRQLTWFKKDKKIQWFRVDSLNWENKLGKRVKNWYDNFNETKN